MISYGIFSIYGQVLGQCYATSHNHRWADDMKQNKQMKLKNKIKFPFCELGIPIFLMHLRRNRSNNLPQ